MHACSVPVQPGEPGHVSVLAEASGAAMTAAAAKKIRNEAVARPIVCISPVGTVRT
jgi:hypothetical protein